MYFKVEITYRGVSKEKRKRKKAFYKDTRIKKLLKQKY